MNHPVTDRFLFNRPATDRFSGYKPIGSAVKNRSVQRSKTDLKPIQNRLKMNRIRQILKC
jgi:hypothetical protein